MSTPVCIANAVADATGAKDLNLPLTSSKMSALISGEEPARPAAPAGQGGGMSVPVAGGKGLQGQGETIVPASPEQVWQTILDPVKLAKVIPGCHKLNLVAKDEYRAEVSLGVGVVKGRFQAEVKLTNLKPPHSAVLSGSMSGPLGASSFSGSVHLEGIQGGTKVRYTYAIVVSGKAAAVGGRMLDGATRVLVSQFFQRLVALTSAKSETAQLTGLALWWQRVKKLLGVN